VCVLQDHYDDERDKIVFHNTTSDLQDQDQDHSMRKTKTKTDFLVSDRSCPKTDGLRPSHCHWYDIWVIGGGRMVIPPKLLTRAPAQVL